MASNEGVSRRRGQPSPRIIPRKNFFPEPSHDLSEAEKKPHKKRSPFRKRVRKQFWCAAYGRDFRWVEAETVISAAEKAFGKVHVGYMSVKPAPANPNKMLKGDKKIYLREFAAQHKKRTGFQLKVE